MAVDVEGSFGVYLKQLQDAIILLSFMHVVLPCLDLDGEERGCSFFKHPTDKIRKKVTSERSIGQPSHQLHSLSSSNRAF